MSTYSDYSSEHSDYSEHSEQSDYSEYLDNEEIDEYINNPSTGKVIINKCFINTDDIETSKDYEPKLIDYEDIDNYDFFKPFNEVVASPVYVHLYFEFRTIERI